MKDPGPPYHRKPLAPPYDYPPPSWRRIFRAAWRRAHEGTRWLEMAAWVCAAALGATFAFGIATDARTDEARYSVGLVGGNGRFDCSAAMRTRDGVVYIRYGDKHVVHGPCTVERYDP